MLKNKKEATQPVEVKLLKHSEIPEAAVVYAEAWKKANVGEKWTSVAAKKFFEYFFRRQKALFFVASCEGKVVGGVVGEIVPWWDGAHLSNTELFVHPKFQNRGIAKLLLRATLRKAIRKYKITAFEGIADNQSEFPMRWYNRIGLKRTRWTHVSGDPKEMLRKLSS